MDAVLHLPLDYESWVEYRALKASLGASGATFAMMRLFVDLGYQAQSGRALGLLDEKAQKLFEDGEVNIKDLHCRLPAMVEAGFLSERADGLFCGRFSRLNGHLEAGYKAPHMRGALMSAHVRGQKAYAGQTMQLALMIPNEVWVKEDGEKMSSEEIADVMILIRGCDAALRKAERPHNANGFNQTLVRNAYKVIKEFPPEHLELIVRKILENRGNPSIPPTTEQLLAPGAAGKARFSELAGILVKN